jgi:hypothetical protein
MSSERTPGVQLHDKPQSERSDAGAKVPDSDARTRWKALTVADWLFAITVVAAVVPIAVATARAMHRGWVPVGDNAFFTVRARDVFTLEHLPLLGTCSTLPCTRPSRFNKRAPTW